jgi:hypothetical protein
VISKLRTLATSALALGLAAWAASNPVMADPPTRVARLSYLAGTVSFDPAGTQDWVEAQANRPLITGDSLWADSSSRAELNIGRAAFRLDSQTSVTLTNLDDQVAQLQLAQGTLCVSVRRLLPQDVVEIDTPNLAFSITQPGWYRINVAQDGSMTLATVRNGQANVTGEGRAYTIATNASYSFTGTDLSNSTYYAVPPPDDFDRFCSAREGRNQRSESARYVSEDMIGFEDLDDNGSWQQVDGYGAVWTPSHVDPDWVPYRDGHWAWVDPWGWTWVDAAPWGFAPFHYGRWVQVGPTWGWIPGPLGIAPVYAPALVAFVGGGGVALAVGGGVGVAWFPLGPREIYRPAYAVSPEYVRTINVSNTVVSATYVTTVVNSSTTVHYVNQGVPGAVTAVSQTTFAGGQNTRRAVIPVSREALEHAQVTNVAAVAPTNRSVAPSAAARARPSPQILSRAVIARTPPPPAPVAFAAKQQELAAHPGRPLDAQSEASLRSRSAASAAPAARSVTVVNAPRPAAAAAVRPVPGGPAAQPERTEPTRPESVARPPVPRVPQSPQLPQSPQPPRPVSPVAQPRQPERPSETSGTGRPALLEEAHPAVRPETEAPRPEARPPESRPEVVRPPAPRPAPKEEGKNEKKE